MASRQHFYQQLNVEAGRCRYGKAHDMRGAQRRGTCEACRQRMIAHSAAERRRVKAATPKARRRAA
jgi:hypothetical protein